MSASPERTLDELVLGESLSLRELVDAAALGEMSQSFYELFRVPLRIFSEAGQLLADAAPQPSIYKYLQGLPKGQSALAQVVSGVKGVDPGIDGEASYTCITGATYSVLAISYDGRRLWRLVFGPFLPPTVKEAPESLVRVDPDFDAAKGNTLLGEMSRAKPETVRQIAKHLKSSLDLILFSGHKALLTSNMHLASVRESFRDLQEKNEKLQEAYDRLKELDRLKSNFLATVSHELRTPLTSILGYSEMLSEGIAGEMTGEQTEFVRTIHEKGEQLLELISGLLDLSKLESGTLHMRRSEVDVASIVKDVVQTLTPTARKKMVRIEGSAEKGLPTLLADSTRLRQVLLNLTENAIKFTPQNGSITIKAEKAQIDNSPDAGGDGGMVLFATRQDAIRLSVADTGIGISDAEKTKVFDAFYQVDSSSTREAQGTGLGLSIVKRLVEGHEGKIWIEDNKPKGTVFVVVLPVRDPRPRS